MYALPTIAENVFAAYISDNYTGSYAVTKAFSTAEYFASLLLVKAGRFKEREPFTGVYEGSLITSIMTQVDDAADNPTDGLALHDLTTAQVLDLMENQAALLTSVNATGNQFYLWGYYQTNYDQDREKRLLITHLEWAINCQTLTA